MLARRLVALIVTLACGVSASASERARRWTFSLFENDLSRRTNIESRPTENLIERSVTTWQGTWGVSAERRLTNRVVVGASLERRRDVFSLERGGRLCGPYHNTCFDWHRMEVVSKPATLFVRVAPEWSQRTAIFATAGIRYVAPRVRDLTPVYFVPAAYFGYAAQRRVSAEVRLGAALRLTHRVGVFAEGCRLLRSGADWDPRRRSNAGLRFDW